MCGLLPYELLLLLPLGLRHSAAGNVVTAIIQHIGMSRTSDPACLRPFTLDGGLPGAALDRSSHAWHNILSDCLVK